MPAAASRIAHTTAPMRTRRLNSAILVFFLGLGNEYARMLPAHRRRVMVTRMGDGVLRWVEAQAERKVAIAVRRGMRFSANLRYFWFNEGFLAWSGCSIGVARLP